MCCTSFLLRNISRCMPSYKYLANNKQKATRQQKFFIFMLLAGQRSQHVLPWAQYVIYTYRGFILLVIRMHYFSIGAQCICARQRRENQPSSGIKQWRPRPNHIVSWPYMTTGQLLATAIYKK